MMDEDVIAILILSTVSVIVGALIAVMVMEFADAPIDAPACTLVLVQDDNARIGAEAHAK